MKDIKELRTLSNTELQAELISLRANQLNLRMQQASGMLDKPHRVSQIRKAIAQVKTIMSEKVGKSDD